MDLITDFPLGDDLAVALLILAVLSIAALVAGAVVPSRLRRDEDDAEIDPELGLRLGRVLSAAGSVVLWVGVPLVALSLLLPGDTDQRILRSAFLLVGLLLGPLAAWRGTAVQIASLGLDAERRAQLLPRLGALTVGGALALVVLPVSISLWFLQQAASAPLVALAAGAAVSALALRATGVTTDTAGAASALLVGADENEQAVEAEDNLGAPLLRSARMARRGGAQAADLVAVTAALAALGLQLGLPVLAGEAVLVVLLALGTALLVALVSAFWPVVRPGRPVAGSLRLSALVPSLAGGVGAAVAAALWLPSHYKDLRFDQVGMGNFTDTAIAGNEPMARTELEPQIESAVTDMSQWISATDDSRDAGAFLDVLTLYTISPATVVAGALGLGALVGLGTVVLAGALADRHGGSVLRAARTSRTGGALGTVAGLGSAALVAASALGLVALVAAVISVLSAGVPALALTLLVHAGLGALVVVAGGGAALLAPSLLDRAGAEAEQREAASGAPTGPRAALLVAALLGGVAAVGPIVTTVQVAPRAASVWEERALHAVTPLSVTLLGGVALGVMAVLLVLASLSDAARRAGALAVVAARAAVLDKQDRIVVGDPRDGSRRAAVPAPAAALLAPVVAAYGLGPSALGGYVVGAALTAGGLGLWAIGSAATLEGAADTIGAGRYGGPGSWGHSGALNGAVLAGVLRSSLGATAAPLLLVGALVGALVVASPVGMITGGTSHFLRWGVAVVAVAVVVVTWVVAATAPEVDLEDGEGELSAPLFSRPGDEDEVDTIDAMSWESDGDRRR